jgi:hypothetical protein
VRSPVRGISHIFVFILFDLLSCRLHFILTSPDFSLLSLHMVVVLFSVIAVFPYWISIIVGYGYPVFACTCRFSI